MDLQHLSAGHVDLDPSGNQLVELHGDLEAMRLLHGELGLMVQELVPQPEVLVRRKLHLWNIKY